MNFEDVRDNLTKLYAKRTELKVKGHGMLSGKLRKVNREIKAYEEGARDIMTTNTVALQQSTLSVVDKNNYQNYEDKVLGAYEMYNNTCDYGGELFGGLVDGRISFIGGEGISIVAEKESTKKALEQIIKDNHLDGSRWLDFLRTGELEGKELLVLKFDNKLESGVKVRSFRWKNYKYNVVTKGFDNDIITEINYTENGEKKKLTGNYIYVRLGGTWDDANHTTSRAMKILTDCENFSRAKYDFRTNNHLFGRLTPFFNTKDDGTAASIQSAIAGKQWEIGKGLAAVDTEMKIIGPEGDSSKVIVEEIILMSRIISSMTGIPIHWLAWPDLMSNRATAENLMESVKASTQMERLTWEESLEELFERALEIAVENGKFGNDVLGKFEVKLPFVSLTEIKAIGEALGSFVDKRYISIETLQNKIPGIDPGIEKDRLSVQTEESLNDKVNEQNALSGGNNLTKQSNI